MKGQKIIIGADFVPTETNSELFISGDIQSLIGTEIQQLLLDSDYCIFNLEVPLTDNESPIEKCGPNLIAPTATINGYVEAGVNILTLANNHILDQGYQGLVSTCATLKKNNINYLGVGDTLDEAFRPYEFQFSGKKIGIYACTEHEFSVATAKMPGANPFDPLESPDHIADLKKRCDFVIVLYHGGKEHYRYPSPNLQKTCRKLIDKGADLVVCQHSHCIGCEEKYKAGTIVYGQGNFLFDYNENDYWKTSLLIEIDANLSISYIPLLKEGNTVRIAKDKKAKEILNEFANRSKEILDEGIIQKKYEEFADRIIYEYLICFLFPKRSILLRLLNRISCNKLYRWIVSRKYNKNSLLTMYNFVECEAHRELLITGIGGKAK